MRCAGVDLAAEPRNTAVCVLEVHGDYLNVVELSVGVTDGTIMNVIESVQHTGVDVPVGWPASFARFIADHALGALAVPAAPRSQWRRSLAMRATDLFVREHIGLTPLSVSANLLAYPAFRWAGLEATLRDRGHDVSRDGSGIIAEVYPAAALKCWGLPHIGYKGNQRAALREQILDGVLRNFTELNITGFAALAVGSDHALDALLAALMAYLKSRGGGVAPPPQYQRLALQEGWIWFPAAPVTN